MRVWKYGNVSMGPRQQTGCSLTFTNNAVARVTRRAFTKKAAYGVDTAGDGIAVVQAQFALVDIWRQKEA